MPEGRKTANLSSESEREREGERGREREGDRVRKGVSRERERKSGRVKGEIVCKTSQKDDKKARGKNFPVLIKNSDSRKINLSDLLTGGEKVDDGAIDFLIYLLTDAKT